MGVAQYPYLLPNSLTLAAGAAPQPRLVTETVICVLVGPSFVFLYRLATSGTLSQGGIDHATSTAPGDQPVS